jgi:hypothetical protein
VRTRLDSCYDYQVTKWKRPYGQCQTTGRPGIHCSFWCARAGRQRKGRGFYLGQMSPAVRMTISFVPVQDHDNKSGSDMMLRVTVLRGVIYVLRRSRSRILHHSCHPILLGQQWIEYASLQFVTAMEPGAVQTHQGEQFGDGEHTEFELLAWLSVVHLHIEKPMELFAEQLVWVLYTPPTAAELIFFCRRVSRRSIRTRSGLSTAFRLRMGSASVLRFFNRRRTAIARPAYNF